MASMPTIEVVHCVVCDDVRLEVANKETIVGVYSAGMTVPVLPWPIMVCLWMTVIWRGEGELELETRVLNPRNVQMANVTGSGHAEFQGQKSTITFRNLFFSIEMEGIYAIQWRKAHGNWETIRQLPIYMFRPPTGS
jgi:hypothetical protein